MTLAVVVATEPNELGIAAGLAYDAERSLLERLLEQLALLKVQEIHVIARRDMAPGLRKMSCRPRDASTESAPHDSEDEPDGHEVIESEDLAQDLREIARLARAATEP